MFGNFVKSKPLSDLRDLRCELFGCCLGLTPEDSLLRALPLASALVLLQEGAVLIAERVRVVWDRPPE
jgi:hypothetical protein